MNEDWRETWRARRRLQLRRAEDAAFDPVATGTVMDAMLTDGLQGLFDTGLPRPTRAQLTEAAIRAVLGDQ